MTLEFFMGYDEDGHAFLIRVEHTLFAVKRKIKSDGRMYDIFLNGIVDLEIEDELLEDISLDHLKEIFSQRGDPTFIEIVI